MKTIKIFMTVISVLTFISVGAAQNRTPTAAAKAFYAYDKSHSQVFSRKTIDARKGWFSDELYQLFLNELRREREYLKKNPTDKPYFGDGLPFRPIDEICKAGRHSLHKSVIIKSDTQENGTAKVKAVFAFPAPCKNPDTTIYTLQMIRIGGSWMIDDVLYEDNHGLKQDLKRKDY